jgi:hypothetical protein
VSKPVFTADDARALTDNIKKGLQETWKLIKEAYEKRADKVIDGGYPSWDAYCKAEFGTCYLRVPREELPEIVRSMSLTMGVRPIASALGVSRETVRRAQQGDTNVSPKKAKTPPKPDRYLQQCNAAATKTIEGLLEWQRLCKDGRFGLHREPLVKAQSENVMWMHKLTTQLVPYFADPGVTLLDDEDGAA